MMCFVGGRVEDWRGIEIRLHAETRHHVMGYQWCVGSYVGVAVFGALLKSAASCYFGNCLRITGHYLQIARQRPTWNSFSTTARSTTGTEERRSGPESREPQANIGN
jgi:hypothetical protein